MIKNRSSGDRNGELMEERMLLVESSDLVDDHSSSLLEESSEARTLYASKQRIITIDSSSEDCTVQSHLTSDHLGDAWSEFCHTEEPSSDPEVSWPADRGSSNTNGIDDGFLNGYEGNTSRSGDEIHGGSDSAHQNLYGDAHNFVYDEFGPVYNEPSDLEIVRGPGTSQHDTAGRVPQLSAAMGILRQGAPSEVARGDDSDVVVVESHDLSGMFPRISHEVLNTVLCKMYLAYYSLISVDAADSGYSLSDLGSNLDGRDLSHVLRGFSSGEIEYLRLKIRRILLNHINSIQMVDSLMSLIDPDKTDGILYRNELKTVRFRDMIDRSTTSCMICYESFKSRSMCTSLKCMHTFHSKCVRSWVRQSWCCPLCRRRDI